MEKKLKVGMRIRVVAGTSKLGENIGVVAEVVELFPQDEKFPNLEIARLKLDSGEIVSYNSKQDVVEVLPTFRHYNSGMVRDTDKGKPRYDLTYKPMYKRWAELMARGAEHYGENNWQKANGEEELKGFRASAERHFQQWMNGESDEDHAAAVFFNISGYEFVKTKLNVSETQERVTDEGF